MRPEGSIVVMLFRPRARLVEDAAGRERRLPPESGAPWMLDDGGGVIETITATPELEAMLPSGQGLFYARRIDGGWDVIGPVGGPDYWSPSSPWPGLALVFECCR
jgi:hypothetical protein